MNRSQIYESRYVSTLSSDEFQENIKDKNDSVAPPKRNNEFYNQINKIKKKWENYSNNSRISNLNETNEFNRSSMNHSSDICLDNNLNMSHITLNELKKKWNDVSNRTSNVNSTTNKDISNQIFESNNKPNLEIKRKSIKK